MKELPYSHQKPMLLFHGAYWIESTSTPDYPAELIQHNIQPPKRDTNRRSSRHPAQPVLDHPRLALFHKDAKLSRLALQLC